MKNLALALLALCVAAAAQQPGQPAKQKVQSAQAKVGNAPTNFDLYCAGYISGTRPAAQNFIVGGDSSPIQSRFASTQDRIFVHGNGMKPGDRFLIVRPVTDWNHYEQFPGQRSAIRSAGQPYFEIGYVKIVDVQKETGIAVPELSCSEFSPGDLAVPFAEREKPQFRQVTLDKFAAPNGKAVGRILLANEFDTFLGSKSKVYVNLGEDKGLKPGDYLRITRTYNSEYHDPIDGLSTKSTPVSDQQANAPRITADHVANLPRLTLGDAIVLTVHEKTATAMIMTAFQDIRVGDGVEVMDTAEAPTVAPVSENPNPPAEAPAAAPAQSVAAPATQPSEAAAAPSPAATEAEASNPPTINCSASPSSLRVGESSTISCNASSPDNRPVVVTFTSSAGHISSSGMRATLDTADAQPGALTVRATAFDDRKLSAATTTTVTVEAPPPPAPTAQKALELEFKPDSSYVDNRSKAELDDLALKMQQDPNSSVVLAGAADPQEKPGMASERAQNSMKYLTQSKGIDSKRIQVKGTAQPGHKVDVWTVPAGAAAPPL